MPDDEKRIAALVRLTGKPHLYFSAEDQRWYYTELVIDTCGSGPTIPEAYQDHLYCRSYKASMFNNL